MATGDKELKCIDRKTYRGRGRPKNSDYYYTTWEELWRDYAKDIWQSYKDVAHAEARLLNLGEMLCQ